MNEMINKIAARNVVLAASLCCVLLAGCPQAPHSDKPTGGMTVKVTYGGEPVPEGYVSLMNNQTGLGGGGPLTADGTANISSVAVGEYVVTVTPPPAEMHDPTLPAPKAKDYPNIPKKFRDESTTTLKAKVEPGMSELKIELKD